MNRRRFCLQKGGSLSTCDDDDDDDEDDDDGGCDAGVCSGDV